MDIKELKRVKITNTANARVVTHAFSLAHDEETIINPSDFSSEILDDLNVFYSRGQLGFEEVADEPKKELLEKHTETLKSSNGKEHVVFRPQDKLINVEPIDTSGKAVDVSFSKMDAVDLLSKHWKTLEKAVANIDKKDELDLLLTVAKENEVANKKIEIIENRLGELI